jgi:predicted nucleic acid-binding protein
MTAEWFADTAFLIALFRSRDQYHDRAAAWYQYLFASRARIVTTDLVLFELLNALADVSMRQVVAGFYVACERDPRFEIVRTDPAAAADAVEFYRSRADKEWSLTNCRSFLLLKDRGLRSTLTADHHFQQAGFDPLLLREPPV